MSVLRGHTLRSCNALMAQAWLELVVASVRLGSRQLPKALPAHGGRRRQADGRAWTGRSGRGFLPLGHSAVPCRACCEVGVAYG